MANLQPMRLKLVQAVVDTLEALTGAQVVAIVTVCDNNTLTAHLVGCDQELAELVLEQMAASVWNASKSL